MKDYNERFCNLSLRCLDDIPISMLLQTSQHNLLTSIESGIDGVKANIWKELKDQTEIIESLLRDKINNDKGK